MEVVKERVIHRNLLLPCDYLPVEKVGTLKTPMKNMKMKKYAVGTKEQDSREEMKKTRNKMSHSLVPVEYGDSESSSDEERLMRCKVIASKMNEEFSDFERISSEDEVRGTSNVTFSTNGDALDVGEESSVVADREETDLVADAEDLTVVTAAEDSAIADDLVNSNSEFNDIEDSLPETGDVEIDLAAEECDVTDGEECNEVSDEEINTVSRENSSPSSDSDSSSGSSDSDDDVSEEDDSDEEEEIHRKSQRIRRPRKIYTYDEFGKPSYR